MAQLHNRYMMMTMTKKNKGVSVKNTKEYMGNLLRTKRGNGEE